MRKDRKFLFHPVVAVQHHAKLDSSHVPFKSFHRQKFGEFVLLCQHVMLISEIMLTFNYCSVPVRVVSVVSVKMLAFSFGVAQ